MEMLHEIKSRIYRFQFFENFFLCQYRENFIKRYQDISYRDVNQIRQITRHTRWTVFYGIQFELENRSKPLILWYNTQKDLAILQEAVDYIWKIKRQRILTE